MLRLYLPDTEALGELQYEDVGRVDAERRIFSADGIDLAAISLESRRRWYELFLRRHADVPDGDLDPYGKCVEAIRREYSWRLDPPLRELRFSAHALFSSDEMESLRQQNPFYRDWEEASTRHPSIVRELVLAGEEAPQVRRIGHIIGDRARNEQLTRWEEIQAALDFVQGENIRYVLDEECEEIHHAPEYTRAPVETLFDKRGDCDCKSVLAAVLMRQLGYPVLLLLSPSAIAVEGAPELDEISDLFVLRGTIPRCAVRPV